MIDKMLGHYRIISKIGQGGMGVVYRARDEVLHRDVALKVLARETGFDTSSREYLLHEARSSSALSHPNICTIYEIGEFDGELYIDGADRGQVIVFSDRHPRATYRVGYALRNTDRCRACPFARPLDRPPRPQEL